MRGRLGRIAVLVAAVCAGVMVASAIGAGAATPTVTLGSTAGAPTMNVCGGGIDCTYLPLSNVLTPELKVPFDGTVTSFSVNAGSAGGAVELRVLRPAASGQFTGAGTTTGKILNTGVNTFSVSLPVKAGDLLGLDNSTSALMFDTSSASDIAAYYQPALSDGATAAPTNHQDGLRLLLSATVQEAAQSTTTSSSTTTTTSGPPPSTPPAITKLSQSHRVWREGAKLPKRGGGKKPPVGTAFSFALNQAASVRFAFTRQSTGRKVKAKCVAPSNANRLKPKCTRALSAGGLRFTGKRGSDKLVFAGRLSTGRALSPGNYLVTLVATNSAGQRSKPATLRFTIAK